MVEIFFNDRRMWNPQINVKVNVKRLTSLRGSPHDICCCSSFCSSFRAPTDCWFLTKSESSLSPASVKYLATCSQLRLFAGNNSWKSGPQKQTLSETSFHQKALFIHFLKHMVSQLLRSEEKQTKTNYCTNLVSRLPRTISRAPRLNAEQYCSIAGVGISFFALLSHHEPVVHANLSETGSNRADVLFRKPGFEEFHCEARRNTWINATRTRQVLPTDLQG